MPDTQEILKREARKGRFLSTIAKLPAYDGWDANDVIKNITEVLSSGDKDRFTRFAEHFAENIPAYEGWTPDEIRKNVIDILTPAPHSQQEKFERAVDQKMYEKSLHELQPTPEKPYQPKLLETAGGQIGGKTGAAIGAFLDVPFKTQYGALQGGAEELSKAGEVLNRPASGVGQPLTDIGEAALHGALGVVQPAIGTVMASTAFTNPYSYLFQYVPEAVERTSPEAGEVLGKVLAPAETAYNALGLPEAGKPGAKILDLIGQGALLSRFGVEGGKSPGAESLGREKTIEDYQRELKGRQSESADISRFDMTGEPRALLPQSATQDFRFVNDPVLGTRIEPQTLSAKESVEYAKEAKRVAEGKAQLTGEDFSQQLTFDFPSQGTRFASDYPSAPITERGTSPYTPPPTIIGELPAWIRERLQSEGKSSDRIFNDVDLANPNVRDAIRSDPTLTEVQKTELLRSGSLPKADRVISPISAEVQQFADRVAAGEKMTSNEDVQFYLNNGAEVERALKMKQEQAGKQTELFANERGQTVSQVKAEEARIGVVPSEQRQPFQAEGTNKPDIVIPSVTGGERIATENANIEGEKAALKRIRERKNKPNPNAGEFNDTNEAVEAGRKATKEEALKRANNYLIADKNLRKQKDLANRLQNKADRVKELRRIGLEMQKNEMDNRTFAEGYVAETRGAEHTPYPDDIVKQVTNADKSETVKLPTPKGQAGETPTLKRNTVNDLLGNALTKLGAKKFASLFRKHVDPNFKGDLLAPRDMSFEEHINYLVGDGNLYTEGKDVGYRAFFKEAGIDADKPASSTKVIQPATAILPKPPAPRRPSPAGSAMNETQKTKDAAHKLTKEEYDALAPDVRGAVAQAFGFSGKNMEKADKDRLWRQIEATRPKTETPTKVSDVYPKFKPKKAVSQSIVPEGLRSRVKYQGKTSTGEHEFIIKSGESRGANFVLTEDALGNIEENINKRLAEKEQVFSGTSARKLRDMGVSDEAITKFEEQRSKATTPEEINAAFMELAKDQHKDNPSLLKNKKLLQSVADAMKDTIEREVKPEDVPSAENAANIDEIQTMLKNNGISEGMVNTFVRLVQRVKTEKGLDNLLYNLAKDWYKTNKSKAYDRMVKSAEEANPDAPEKAHEQGSLDALNQIAGELRKNLAEFLPKNLKGEGFDAETASWSDIVDEIKRRYKEGGGLASDEMKGTLRSQFVPNVDPRKVAHILEPIITKAREDARQLLDDGKIKRGELNATMQKFISDGIDAAFIRSGLSSGHLDQLKIAAANLSQYAANVRLDRFSPEGQQVISDAVAAQSEADIARQRRYKRTHGMTEEAAIFEGDVVKEARKGTIEPGTAFNAEQIEAMDSEFDRVARMKAEDPVEFAKEDPDELANLLLTMEGARAEAGRALNILGKEVNPQVAEAMLEIAKQTEDPKVKAAIEEAVKRLRKRQPIPPGLWDKIAEWGRNMKLLSPSPVIKTVVGNGVMQLLKYPELIGDITNEKIRASLAGTTSERSYHEVAADWIGFRSGIGEGIDIARKMLSEDYEALKQSVFLKEETGSTQGAIGGTLGKVVRTPQRFHGALDAVYRIPTARGLIGREAVRMALAEGKDGQAMIDRANELMAQPTKEMVAKAATDARYYTFQTELGNFGKKINQLRFTHPVLQTWVPFYNTPVNLFKTMVEHTPFAPLTPSFQQALLEALSKPSNDPKSTLIHGYERITGKEFKPGSHDIDVKISRMVAGTATIIGMGMMIGKMMDGTVTGRAPKNKLDREALERSGWQEYSIKFGDKYYSYKGFEPVSGWLGILSDYLTGYKDESTNRKVFTSTINLVKNFAENPFLVGAKEASDAISDPETAGFEKWAAGTIAGMIVPTVIQQAQVAMDPTRRKAQSFDEFMIRKTPGLTDKLLPERNVFGEPIVQDLPATRMFGTRISKETHDPVNEEVARLGIKLGWADDTFEGIELTPEKYDKLLEISGKNYKHGLDLLMKLPAYAMMTDGMKMSTIRSLQSHVRDAVRTGLLGSEMLQAFMNKVELNLTGGIVPPEKKEATLQNLRRLLPQTQQVPAEQQPAAEPAPVEQQ